MGHKTEREVTEGGGLWLGGEGGEIWEREAG